MSETIEHSESSSLPDGWCLLTVNEIKSDKNYSCVGGPFGSNLTTADYVGSGGVPVIRGTNLSGSNNRFKDDGFVYVCEKKADSLRQNMAFPNDLIFTQRGTLGQVGHIPDNARFARYVVSQSQMKLTVSKNIASTDYIYHYFSSPNVLRLIENSVEATGVPHITLGILKSFPVPLPPLPQQRKIARILTTVDDLIEQTEALIEKYKSIKQGMMHDLFTRGVDQSGQLRPSYEDAPHLYKQSPLGWIPKEWEAKTLNDTISPARPIVYGILMPGYGHPGGIPVIKVKDIKNGKVQTDHLLLTSLDIDNQYRRSKTLTGDLLFTIRGTVGRMAFVPKQLEGANITQDTARIGVVHGDPRFIRDYLSMPEPKRFVTVHTLGAAVQGINLGDVRRVPIGFPSIEEQEEIGRRAEVFETILSCEQSHLGKLQLIKSGLMQDLLTGKVRVNVNETEEVTANV